MSELLSKEVLAEIKRRKPYQYGTISLTVAERNAIVAYCQALESDLRDAEQWIADVEEREAAVCPEGVPFDNHIRALEAERNNHIEKEIAQARLAGEWELRWDESQAQLHETEAERDAARLLLQKNINEIISAVSDDVEAVETFRRRAIEAVRARFGSEGILAHVWNRSDAEFDAAVSDLSKKSTIEDEIVELLQSLPTTSEQLTNEDNIAIAQQQAADLNHGD